MSHFELEPFRRSILVISCLEEDSASQADIGNVASGAQHQARFQCLDELGHQDEELAF